MENGWSLRLVLPLLAAALMADFGVRQIYLWGKRPPTAPGGPQGQATHPGRAVPHPDPQQIGAKPDRTHPYYHHGWPIYDRSEETWRGRRYLHLTDSLGFRNEAQRETPLRKTKFRILLIGDSNLYGVGLDWGDTLTAFLRQAFPRAEFLNAAVPSYSPTVIEAKLRWLISQPGLQADAVLVFIDVADIDDELSYERRPDGSVHKNPIHFAERPENQNWADGLAEFLEKYPERHLFVVGTIVRNLRQWLRRHGTWAGMMAYEKGRWAAYDGHLNPEIERAIIRATAALTRLNEFLQAKGMRMVLVVTPNSAEMEERNPRTRAEAVWKSWAEANHVPILSLFPEFFARAENYEAITQSSRHWNEQGHRWVAEILVRRLPTVVPQLKGPP